MDAYLVNLATTLSVFCATTWQLLLTFQTGSRKRDHAAFVLRGLCMIGIAVGMLGIFLRDLARHDYAAPWYVLLVRVSLTVLLVYPWRRRETDR
jgi:hypothetical protein